MQLCAGTADVGTMPFRPYAPRPYAPIQNRNLVATYTHRFFLESCSYLLTTTNTLTEIIAISVQLCASTRDVGTMPLRPYTLMPYAPIKKPPYAPTLYAPTPLRSYALFYRFF